MQIIMAVPDDVIKFSFKLIPLNTAFGSLSISKVKISNLETFD